MAARGGSTMTAEAAAKLQAVSAELAGFVVEYGPRGLSSNLRHEAKRSILNGLATALAGAQDPAVSRMAATLTAFSGPTEAGVIGRAERFDALNVAFLNAVSTNVFDFDDTHPGTIIHPTAPVSPALFAFAERQSRLGRPIPGAALLDAFALGVEVECRIGNAVSPGHYKRGWHITSTCGVFGAAAAVGRLLGLDRDRMLSALGIASAQAGGTVETLGTMAKSVSVGNAARNGLLSALLAQGGVEGPAYPIEGERGFLRLTCDMPRPELVTDGLGEVWEALRNTYKPYPCGVVLNPVLEASLDLAKRRDLRADSIVEIVVSGHLLLRERTDRPNVEIGREAQVSAQHAVAVSLLRGTAGLADFSDAAVHDPAILALRQRVRIEVDDAMAVGSARLVVMQKDGHRLEATVERARGDEGRPLEDRDIEEKVRALAAYGSPTVDPEPLIAAVWALDRIEDAAEIPCLAVME